MKLTAGQIGYLPYLGFFAKVAQADVLCSFDAVQYEKRGWNNRNYIKTANGPLMLSVPVKSKDHFSKRLCEIEIVPGGWARKHLRSIDLAYHKAPYFSLYYETLVDIILPYSAGGLLHDLNEKLLRFFMAKLGMERPIVRASSYQFNGHKSDLVLDMALQLKASSYIFGGEGKNYADAQGFRNAGVEPIFQQYVHPVYPQLHGQFVEKMSVVDLLMNAGPDSLTILSAQP